jgi:hypothetical protein
MVSDVLIFIIFEMTCSHPYSLASTGSYPSVSIISTYTIIFVSILYYIGYNIVCIEYKRILYVYVMYAERYQIILITIAYNIFLILLCFV